MVTGPAATARSASGLWPWLCVLLTAGLMVVETTVSFQNTVVSGGTVGPVDWLFAGLLCLLPLAFATMGAFIETRRPGNRIGRLMIAFGLLFAAGTVATDYPAAMSSAHHVTRPFGLLVLWVSTWIWNVFLAALFSLLLLFPTGELPSRRWRPVLWGGFAVLTALGVVGAVQSGPTSTVPVDNPLGIIPIPGVINVVLVAATLGVLAAALISLVVRYRASDGDVRQQLKWFTYGTLIALPLFMAAGMTDFGSVSGLLAFAALATLPFCMGIAVLKYRLYDIDVLINRTLLWVSLTLSLGALYVGGVLGLQALFRSVTGQASDLTVALATLAVAALFNPWRHRLQGFIDRRFYRRKYDAVRILGTLSATLRNDVELRQVTEDITSAVHETMQPAHISIWLR